MLATPPWDSVEALWAARWAVVTEVVLQGGTNVLLLDADTALHRDPYEELHSPCLAAAQLVGLQERDAHSLAVLMQVCFVTINASVLTRKAAIILWSHARSADSR